MKLSSQCRKPLSFFLAVALLLTGIFPGIPLSSGQASAETATLDTSITAAPAVTASPATDSTVSVGSTITLQTSEPASVFYSVYGNDSTTAFLENAEYQDPIIVGAEYATLTIKAYSSLPDLEQGPTATFKYTVTTIHDNLKISQIQGAGHTSPYADSMVSNVKGIVTYIKDANNFYIQSADADKDNDIKTSEAILIYQKGGSSEVKVGDAVTVDGLVQEYGFTRQLTTTEIAASTTTVLSSGNKLPEAILLGTGGRIIPHAVIDDDKFTKFDPDSDAIDFYESLEGMRLELAKPTTVGPAVYYASSSTFEIPVITVNGTANTTEVTSAAGGLVLTGADYNPQRLILSAKSAPVLTTGQQFTSNIIGILTYDYGKFLVSAENTTLPEVSPSKLVREVTSLSSGEAGKLNIASFNIENFSKHDDPKKIASVAKDIVFNLNTPDIIGLTEVQDNNSTGKGVTEADENYEALIAAIKAFEAINGGASDYAYTDIAPENNMDGGVPEGNIRSGFLYNKKRVTLKTGTRGSATEAVSYSAASGLSLNPGRIDPGNAAFNKSRKPLAAEFTFEGNDVIVVANHFNSKSSDNYLFGSVQPPVFTTEVQRAQIAKVVNGFVEDVLQENPDANVVVLGDLNDFQFSNTLNILKGSALTNLVNTLPLNERYSYVFQGNSQTLDHILVNNKLASASTLDIVHINADFADPGDYPKDTEFPADIRVSDHDPLLAQIDFGTEDFNLRVLHTNDTHGHLENVAKRTSATSSERTGNTVLLDAGDVFSGTLYFNQFQGQADIEFMNHIGYDAMTFGNHEFDMNKEHPEVLRDFVTAAKFPFASANIDFTTKGSELADLYHDMIGTLATDEAKSTAEDGHIYPSVIKEVYGEKIGIFGLTTEDTVGLASPGDKIIFKDHVESARKTVEALEAQGINKIIAVTHLGYTVDQELAKAVPGIDIIVGGHSHTKIDNPPREIVLADTDQKVLIVQTGEYSQFLGELDVTFDKKGEIKAYKGKLLDVNLFGKDAAASALLAPYDAKLATVRNTVVGYSNVDLYTHINSVRVVRSQETPIGNMIADSIAEKVTELMPSFVSPADRDSIKGVVAIQNGGGIREAINVGEITMGEVLTTLPFGNGLAALKVTGAEIVSSLENAVSGISSDQGRFAHVSGMKYTYDSTKTPEIVDPLTGKVTQAGNRIVSVEIKQADGSYLPLDPQAYYILSTNSFMAGGGDFYRALASAKADGRYYELGLPDFEVLLSYLKNHNPVTSSVEGRIVDLKGTTPTPTPTPTPGTNNPPGGGPGNVPTATVSPSPAPTGTPAASSPPQVTTIAAADLTAQLAALPAGSNTLVIPLTASAGGAQVVLPASVLIQQAAAHPDTVLTFNSTGGASYSLPLSMINGTALAAQLGTSDFTITVSILQADPATLSGLNTALAAQAGSVTLAAPVIEFSITAQAGSNSVTLNNFGSTYVERTITAARALNSQTATAVSYDPATGKLSFVPSVFSSPSGGTTEVTIKRNSNSYYTVVESTKSFGDTAGHWAQPAIELLASKLIITGTSSTAFSPSLSITRAEFAALISRSLGLASASGGTTFSDVSSNAWYVDAVQTAAAAGLITGYSDGSFKPGHPISRQEMAAVLSKAIKYTGTTLTADPAVLAKFSDASGIPAWSRTAVAEIAAQGIIQGTPDGAFAPAKLATRAEAATMLEKTLKSLQFIN